MMKKSWLLVFFVLVGEFVPQQVEARCFDPYYCKEKKVDSSSDSKAAWGVLFALLSSFGLVTYGLWKYEGPQQAFLLLECLATQAGMVFATIIALEIIKSD